MKTDNYLTLCLEQAAKSPLHYRHGCIIVRGGKVIGQGHNDYRPGFDGGALKHGRRKENKAKPKDNQQPPQPPRQLAAFEKVGAGGGPHANTPLSMHSEMMAIHSALSTSSNLACSSFSHDKPSFKLPRGDKKKERLRRDVLQNYVERICEASTSSTPGQAGKLQVQDNNVHHVDREAQRRADGDRAFQAVKSMEKHHVQNAKKNQKHHEYEQYEYHKGRSGSQTPRGSSQRHRQQHGQQPSASKSQDIQERTIRSYDRRMIDDVLGNGLGTTQSSPERGKPGKDHKGSKKAKSLEQPQVERFLHPQGENGKSRAEVNDRKKHPRLAGAYLYVTRLGWNNNNIAQPNPKKKFVKPSAQVAALSSSSESDPGAFSLPSSASSTARSAILVLWIKRVFCTNDDGEWEGGKVARFIDALDGEADGAGCAGGPMGNGVFVTKHEVLMMRKKMGD
ncbi:hypothetical protein Q7P35_009110 [Cladosporium inversicolor]